MSLLGSLENSRYVLALLPPLALFRRVQVRHPRVPQRPRVTRRRIFASPAVHFRGGTRPRVVFLPACIFAILLSLSLSSLNVSFPSRHCDPVWLVSFRGSSMTAGGTRVLAVFEAFSIPRGLVYQCLFLNHPGHPVAYSRRDGDRQYRLPQHHRHPTAAADASVAPPLLPMLG